MFRIEFETDNAAFDGDAKADEIVRILRMTAHRVREADVLNGIQGDKAGTTEGPVRDTNGNTVGKWQYSE